MDAEKCDSCGRFCKMADLVHCANEDEVWTECRSCSSPSGIERLVRIHVTQTMKDTKHD